MKVGSDPTLLPRLIEAAGRLNEASAPLIDERNAAIRAARDGGFGLREIAAAADLSIEGVRKIAQRRTRR